MKDFIIEVFSARNGCWAPYASNTSREWAEKDAARYRSERPHDQFRVESDTVRSKRLAMVEAMQTRLRQGVTTE